MTMQRWLKPGIPHNVLEGNIFWNRILLRLYDIRAEDDGLGADGVAVGRMFHRNATILNGNGLSSPDPRDTYWPYDGFIRQSPAAVDDEFEHSCFVPPGTYDLMVMGDASTSSGIVEWSIDGTVVGPQDWYTTPDSDDPVLKIINDIPVAGGWVTVSGLITGKNASSAGYLLSLMKYALRRTGG